MAMSAKLNLLQPLTCNSDVSIWVKEDDKQQTNADLSLSFNLSFAREINSENPEVKSRETQPYISGLLSTIFPDTYLMIWICGTDSHILECLYWF